MSEESSSTPKTGRFDAKKKKTFWLTRAMAEEYSREDVLYATCTEAVVFAIFIIAVTISTIGRRTSSMYYLTQVIKGQFINKEFSTVNDVGITFEEIKSASDFWHYAESLMLNSFYWEYYYNPFDPVKPAPRDDQKILYENKLLGVPRLRQVKVRNDSCVIHSYFRRLFAQCYSLYSSSSEDTESFGLGTRTAWVYSTAAETKSISYPGIISTYEGGGYYQDLENEKNASIEIIQELKDNLWITRGTRAVFVDFAIYNANLNLFAICKLVFEFPPTGGIIPSASIQPVHLVHFVKFWDYVRTGMEYTVYVMAVFYAIEEIREIIYFKWRYFAQFWTYIDLTIITLALANFIISLILLPDIDEGIESIKKHPNKYGNLEFHANVKSTLNNCAACLLFLSYIKLFKYLSFNKTMGQLNNTLRRCALDILGFSIMFFIIFIAFAELGYLVFGSQVEDFSSFGVAMFTLLRTILGDFDYTAIEKANRVLAPIYFLSYIFFVFFVLLNMFLAIINDSYADVKTEIALAPDEMQMHQFLKRGLYKCLNKLGCNVKINHEKAQFNATIQQIRDALKKCGFSDLEIEMFFARYNIDPLAEVGEYDVKKIIQELEEGGVSKEKAESDADPLVNINDFITQQERLNQIERMIEMLVEKIDALMRKLDAMENVRKVRINQG